LIIYKAVYPQDKRLSKKITFSSNFKYVIFGLTYLIVEKKIATIKAAEEDGNPDQLQIRPTSLGTIWLL
jgi:hypothetical protein